MAFDFFFSLVAVGWFFFQREGPCTPGRISGGRYLRSHGDGFRVSGGAFYKSQSLTNAERGTNPKFFACPVTHGMRIDIFVVSLGMGNGWLRFWLVLPHINDPIQVPPSAYGSRLGFLEPISTLLFVFSPTSRPLRLFDNIGNRSLWDWLSGKSSRGKKCPVSLVLIYSSHFSISSSLLQFTFSLKLQGVL